MAKIDDAPDRPRLLPPVIGDRRVPPAAWIEPSFLYYLSANLLLRSSVRLYEWGLIPRAALTWVLEWAETLSNLGAASLQRRRARLRRRSGGPPGFTPL
jgi:hypothetical protein